MTLKKTFKRHRVVVLIRDDGNFEAGAGVSSGACAWSSGTGLWNARGSLYFDTGSSNRKLFKKLIPLLLTDNYLHEQRRKQRAGVVSQNQSGRIPSPLRGVLYVACFLEEAGEAGAAPTWMKVIAICICQSRDFKYIFWTSMGEKITLCAWWNNLNWNLYWDTLS